MKTAAKTSVALSPLMRAVARKNTSRLVGTLTKTRARAWIKHIEQSRKAWK